MDFWTEVIYNAVKMLAMRVWLLTDWYSLGWREITGKIMNYINLTNTF